jgi:hypothetical protein
VGKGTKRLENIFTPTVDEINQGFTINAWHVSQSVNAFTGTGSYDIDIDGSLTVTGSIYHESAQDAAGVLSNVVVRNNETGEYFITGSYGGSGGGSSFDISQAAVGEFLFKTSATSADGKYVQQYYANGSYGKGLTIGYIHSKNAGLNIYETSNNPQGYSEDHIILSDSSGSDLIIRNGGKEAGDGYIFLKVDELGASGTAFNVAKLGGPDKSVYLYHSGSNVFRTEYIGGEASVIIPAPFSASSDVYLSGLSNTSKPHIVGYDAATGQLTYYSTGSFGSSGGSGTSGSSGSSGTSGSSGSGTSGSSGSSGTSGSSGEQVHQVAQVHQVPLAHLVMQVHQVAQEVQVLQEVQAQAVHQDQVVQAVHQVPQVLQALQVHQVAQVLQVLQVQVVQVD